MTFSIVGRDSSTGDLGVAVASKFLGVGAAVPAARLGLGAIATQSFANTLYKRDGLAALAHGLDADATLARLLAADELREERQVGVVDDAGGGATFTGASCMQWAGGIIGPDVAIQGNILVGPQVVDAMHTAWTAAADASLARRLYAALVAGDRAGGDRRGRQSSALFVVSEVGGYTPGDDVAYDLRVDDHTDPVGELGRLLDIHDVLFKAPSTEDLLPLQGDLAWEVRQRLQAAGYKDLDGFAGVENLELRLRDGWIDKTVLRMLRSQTER
ncbi:MAG: DUF1028 domain-containing protein [Actinomycetota bacterium]|nr:DUF1028 domain-containing protein [Actinomycetota bacterium]